MPGDTGDHHHAGLADQRVEHDPAGQAAEFREPAVPAPPPAEAEPAASQRNGHDQHLDGDSQRGADAKDQQFRLAHAYRVGGDLARHHCIHHNCGDDDNVVEHWRPGGGAEHAADVEDRLQQRGHPVTDDAGQQQVCEGGGQRGVGAGVGAEVELGEQGGGDYRSCGGRDQQHPTHGDHPLGVRLALTCAVLLRPDQ